MNDASNDPRAALLDWWDSIVRQRLGRTRARNSPSLIEATAREMHGAFATIKGTSLTRADALVLLLDRTLPEQAQMARQACLPPRLRLLPQPPHRRTFTCRTT
jgi:hypothetical protein